MTPSCIPTPSQLSSNSPNPGLASVTIQFEHPDTLVNSLGHEIWLYVIFHPFTSPLAQFQRQ